MKKWVFLGVFLFLQTGICSETSLKTGDVSKVMDQFFSIHVEQDRMNAKIVKRAMRLYIERFDPEKLYLLQREVVPYLNMSEAEAKRAIVRYTSGDFSDFEKINEVIQKAIVRHRFIRQRVQKELLDGNLASDGASSFSNYSNDENEIYTRLKSRMSAFIEGQDKKWGLSTLSRKEKAFLLFEKRIARAEGFYLFKDSKGQSLSSSKKEHYFTLHMLKAFSKSLDTHTAFFSDEEAYQMRTSLQKKFEGVGVVLTEGIDGVVITDVIKGGSADLSGKVAVDDLLIEVNGKSLKELAFEEVMEVLKTSRSEIRLGLLRKDGTEQTVFFRVTLERKPIEMEGDRITVSYEKNGSGIVGTIVLRSFYESELVSAEKDIKKAIRELEKKGDLQGLVLDLRDNPGGFLSQAVKVSGLFIKSGVVVIAKYANNEMHYLRTLDAKTAYNGPLVVLTSKLSASAAEITAQALQDYGVAVVVGDKRTFGKGSIQYQTVTDTGAEFYYKVTVGKYYTASGRTTQLEGVKSDIVVPSQYSPYLIGEKYLEYPLTNDRVQPALKDSLSDLDPKAKKVFEKYYLPHVQRVVGLWNRMLPELKKNSQERIQNSRAFQVYLQNLKLIQAKVQGADVEIDFDQAQISEQDLQMKEAVNIVKDMIRLEAKIKSDRGIAKSLRKVSK